MEASLFMKDVMSVLKKYGWLMLILAVLGGAIGRFAAPEGPAPTYKASSAVLIERNIKDTNVIVNQSDENTRFLNTAQVLLRTPVILDQVKENLGTDLTVKDLITKMTVVNDNNSQVIRVMVEAESAELASGLANETLEVFTKEVGNYLDVAKVAIVEPAVPGLETEVGHSRINANTIMGVIIGVVLGALASFVLNSLTKNRARK